MRAKRTHVEYTINTLLSVQIIMKTSLLCVLLAISFMHGCGKKGNLQPPPKTDAIQPTQSNHKE
jgi:predicted small lipoprotein YifL